MHDKFKGFKSKDISLYETLPLTQKRLKRDKLVSNG